MATQVQDTLTRPMAQPGAGGDMRHLLVASIIASKTNPRTHFPDASMASLRESIRYIGVRQPVLVRPLPASRVEETTRGARVGRVPTWPLATTSTVEVAIEYELVAGERRWRCSDLEGLEYIPALICQMTDEEVVAFQLVENLQREDLTPLEEATGYRRLMDEFGLSLAQIAERTGNSKSQIHSMVKLLAAIPPVQKALEENKLPSTRHALLIARLPNEGLQKKALEKALHKDYENQQISVRSFESWLQREVLLKLNDARFAIKDATLVPEAGACKACPKRTGADAEAFAFASTDLCLDPACYNGKEAAHLKRERAQALASGMEIIEGREAKAIMPSSWSTRVEGYLRLDDASDSPTDKPLRAEIGKAMEAAGIKPTMVANPHREGELVAVLLPEQVGPLLQQAGKVELAAEAEKRAASAERAKAEEAKTEAKTKFENTWRHTVLRHIIDQMAAGPDYPTETVLRTAANHFAGLLNTDNAKALCKLLNLGKVAPKEGVMQWVTDAPDAGQALTILLAYRDCSYSSWAETYGDTRHVNDNPTLRLIATGCGVNVEQVQKQVKARIKEEDAATAAADAAKAAKQAEEPGAQPDDAKAPGAKKPAALARSNARAKKPSAAAEAPKDSPQYAAANIAAALAELEEGQDVAPTAQGNEAPPAPAGGDAPQPDQPAGGIQLGAEVRIKPNATGKKQAPHIGKQGTVLRQIGPDAWDISIPREKRGVPLFVCFHTTELEVLA